LWPQELLVWLHPDVHQASVVDRGAVSIPCQCAQTGAAIENPELQHSGMLRRARHRQCRQQAVALVQQTRMPQIMGEEPLHQAVVQIMDAHPATTGTGRSAALAH